jgi:hypothetical protein
MLIWRHYKDVSEVGVRGRTAEAQRAQREEGRRIPVTQSFCDYTVSMVFKGALWMLKNF